MKECLSLSGATMLVACAAVVCYLGRVAGDGFPALYLSYIILVAPTEIIPTVPLEPPLRVVCMYPSFCLPHGQRLARSDTIIIEFFMLLPVLGQFGVLEPFFRKFRRCALKITSTKNTKFKHLCWSKVWFKVGMEVFPLRFRVHFLASRAANRIFFHMQF